MYCLLCHALHTKQRCSAYIAQRSCVSVPVLHSTFRQCFPLVQSIKESELPKSATKKAAAVAAGTIVSMESCACTSSVYRFLAYVAFMKTANAVAVTDILFSAEFACA